MLARQFQTSSRKHKKIEHGKCAFSQKLIWTYSPPVGNNYGETSPTKGVKVSKF